MKINGVVFVHWTMFNKFVFFSNLITSYFIILSAWVKIYKKRVRENASPFKRDRSPGFYTLRKKTLCTYLIIILNE